MGKVIVFPLVLRSPGPDRNVDRGDVVVAFPYSRRRYLVEEHARAMRDMTPDGAGAYLISVLEQVCEDLAKVGLNCADADDMIVSFATAIGRELHGPHFQLQLKGVK